MTGWMGATGTDLGRVMDSATDWETDLVKGSVTGMD